MIVTYIHADGFQEWNCSYYNCIMPMRAFNRRSEHESYTITVKDFAENTPATQQLMDKSDIIIVERNLFGDTLTVMNFWKVRGKTVCTTWDDAYDLIEPGNKTYRFWANGEIIETDEEGKPVVQGEVDPHPLKQLRWGLRMVKAGFFPSVNLCKDWGRYTRAYHIRNQLELSRYENITPLFPHPENEIWIGWCGSLSHLESFTSSGILSAMKRLVEINPNIRILIGGDKRVYDHVDVGEDKKKFTTFVPVADFPRLLKSYDIPLAPLHSPYDMRRSWIKVLEYMVLQIPWVATDCITYAELKPFGTTVQNTEEGWFNGILSVVDTLKEKREYAMTDPYQFARSYDIDAQLDNRVRAYQHVIDSEYPVTDADCGYFETPIP